MRPKFVVCASSEPVVFTSAAMVWSAPTSSLASAFEARIRISLPTLNWIRPLPSMLVSPMTHSVPAPEVQLVVSARSMVPSLTMRPSRNRPVPV